MNISVPASHQTKKPSNAETSQPVTREGGGWGVTAPNKYHMPKQLAPPSLLVETLKKTWMGWREWVYAYGRVVVEEASMALTYRPPKLQLGKELIPRLVL